MGLVAQSLYARNTPVYDEVESFKFQTLQVSAVSVTNFAGRIFIGELVWSSLTRASKVLIFIRDIHGFRQEQDGSTPGVLHFLSCNLLLHLSASSNVHPGC